MTINMIPIVIMILGLLMYCLVPHAKAQEIGRIMFFCGLLSVCLGQHSLSIQVK